MIEVIPYDGRAELYHYTASGLSNYWLGPDFYEKGEKDGEPIITFLEFDNLHAAIGLHICQRERLLAPDEVRFIRNECGLSRDAMGHMLGLADKQMIAMAESKGKIHKPLSLSLDRLLRLSYLIRLGGDWFEAVDEVYKQQARQQAQDVVDQIVEDRTSYAPDQAQWMMAEVA